MENLILLGLMSVGMGAIGVVIGVRWTQYQATLETRLLNTATKAITQIEHLAVDDNAAVALAVRLAQRTAAVEALKTKVNSL